MANDVRVDVDLDTAKAEGEAQSFKGKMTGVFSDIGKVAGGVLAAGAAQQVGGFFKSAIEGAVGEEAATRRLEQALRNAGGAYDDNLGKVNAAIDAGQKKAFTDDEVRDSFQQLLAATGDVNEALDRQKLAMDLSRGAGISLESASRMVGKVTDENVEAFKRMGITIGEGATEAEALAAVQGKFAGQSDAYAKSTAGQFEQAKIRMAEVQEEIGTKLLPVVTNLGLIFLNDVVPAIEKFVEVAGPKMSEFAEKVKTAWEQDIKPALDNLRRAWEQLSPVIIPILETIGNHIKNLGSIFRDTVQLILAIISGDWGRAWDEAKQIVGDFVKLIKDDIEGIKDIITGAIPLVVSAMTSMGSAMASALRDAFSAAVGFITSIINGIIDAYNSTAGRIPGVANIPRIGGGGGGGSTSQQGAPIAGGDDDQLPDRQIFGLEGAGGGGGGTAGPTGAYGQGLVKDAGAWVYPWEVGSNLPQRIFDWQNSSSFGQVGQRGQPIHVTLNVDGRVLAEVVTNEMARAM